MPLTVIIPATAPAHVSALRQGKPLPAVPQASRILLEVIPGQEPVTVSWE